ncbi:MAG: hypothetical protein ACJ8R9_05525 [Steroidobacteraceae bacterium]
MKAPQSKDQCNCEHSDAWRCAVARNLSTVACHCHCHRYLDEPRSQRDFDSDPNIVYGDGGEKDCI